MSDRTLYIQRTDRGDRLLALSLVGPRTCDTWHAGETSTVEGALAAVRDGAAWVRERLSASERHTLATLCLDPDGTICSWLSAPNADPAVIAAVARGVTSGGHEGEHDIDHLDAAAPAARALDHFASVGAGMALQSLTVVDTSVSSAPAARQSRGATTDAASRTRLAVLGVPDSVAGLLIDALDTLGVPAPPAIALWHAMARAWDPSSPANARPEAPRTERLVADVAPVTAVVLVEPHGRLTWAWSCQGTLLTGGTIRLARARVVPSASASGADAARIADATSTPRLDASQAARLAAEWLAWSAQIGAAPGRMVLLTPERTVGLAPAEFAGALVNAWPGAMIDVLTHDDPVTHTLQRALDDDAPRDPASALLALTSRPVRAHRSMYLWSALAITGLALAAIVWAIMAWRTAGDARTRASQIRSQTGAITLEHYDGDANAYVAGIILTLQDELARLQAADTPSSEIRFRPVMQELENISLAVSSLIASSPECELRSLTIDNLNASLTLRFDGISTFEEFRSALPEIGQSSLNWTQPSLGTVGAQANEATFRGGWRTSQPGGGGAP